MKLIVTHISVDLDSITSCWLINKFLPGWKKAQITFVPAGQTYQNKPADINPNIIHVDTGLGKFDHHQTNEYTSATDLVFKFLCQKKYIKNKSIEPLRRVVNYVNDIDHFAEVYYPDPTNDRYDFNLSQIIEGLKGVLQDDLKRTILTFDLLNAVFQVFKNKVNAEKEIKKGFILQSQWGKTLILESQNEEAVKLALKMKFHLVVRKDPNKKFLRIKALPNKNIDLTSLYDKLKVIDPEATWFLHSSKIMLLNGSAKNPKAIPTKITLNKILEILKKI